MIRVVSQLVKTGRLRPVFFSDSEKATKRQQEERRYRQIPYSDLPARFEGSLAELFEQRHQLQCGFTCSPSGCLVAFESLKICILLKSCDAIVDLFE